MKTKLYDGDEFVVDGLTFRVNFEQDECTEYPWEFCDGHGPVRQASMRYQHEYGQSDKRPGERPLNSASRTDYQFYYDWQEAMRIAKRDGWGPGTPAEAVQKDFDYLRRYIAGDWCYLIVSVTHIETGETDCLDMVESEGSYHNDVAYEMADAMAVEYRKAHRFADAMTCGV